MIQCQLLGADGEQNPAGRLLDRGALFAADHVRVCGFGDQPQAGEVDVPKRR